MDALVMVNKYMFRFHLVIGNSEGWLGVTLSSVGQKLVVPSLGVERALVCRAFVGHRACFGLTSSNVEQSCVFLCEKARTLLAKIPVKIVSRIITTHFYDSGEGNSEGWLGVTLSSVEQKVSLLNNNYQI
ncbi:uncharacterized protein LOC119301358 [Triticum dicoccoides]|uniref:uncharacterized protein LOC119301358 n=1 Tax=Triticum dicoccoides TaxID=85692 RepID=UPI0018909DCE|nr:uncharacterized protein LOC119301358 [Triticum dicoccoides]